MSSRSLLVALILVGVLAVPGMMSLLGGAERPPLPVSMAAVPGPPLPDVDLEAAPAARSFVDPAWIRAISRRTGVPRPAVRAYATAQVLSSCRAGWTTVAAIGWVESQHGSIGDRALRPDGRSTRRVIGPALDGRGPVAAIPAAPSSVRWHGDPLWEHAVGPMQFLPATWRQWAADGDRDGRSDPFDIDDAALAAAAYLCASGDLATSTGWADAVWAYNNDGRYVDLVYATAVAYSEQAAG